MTKPRLDQGPDYERGFVDGMQHQMQSSVDRAVNAMTQPTYYIPSKDQKTWLGLEKEDMPDGPDPMFDHPYFIAGMVYAHNKLLEKNK